MPKAISPDKVALYIRWSTEDQGQGTTLAVQQEGCTHFALSQGWQVRPELIFVDDGYSGGTIDRPSLSRLRQAVDAGEVECVVVFKLDRLSRSVVDMVKLVIEEWGDRCCIKSAREPIDTASHAGKMFFYTLTNFAEWERNVIRERTFAGKTKRAQAGRNPGFRPPYGYAPSPEHGFIIVPEEAEVVRRIFAQYVAGQGAATIARELNESGPPFRGGRPWHAQTVTRLLQNPLYTGDLCWGVRRYNPNHGKRPGEVWWPKNEQPLVVVPGAAPPIIGRALFKRAQRVRASRPSPRRGQSGRAFTSPYLLTGLLRCARCGAPMRARPHSSMPGRRYYYCPGRPACDGAYIPTDALDQLVGERILCHYADQLRPPRPEAQAERALTALEARRCRLLAQRDRLGREYREAVITIEEYRRFLAEAEADLADVAEAVARAQEQRQEPPPRAPWGALTLPEQRAVLRHLLARVTAYRQGRGPISCELTWRTPKPVNPACISSTPEVFSYKH